ncbi:1,4-dihydroxy-2-naphthoyl-CoA synthase [Actinomyces gaoshouyii]|uniref:1,4-dihydroxy-2-naphthoyl-CoA synthase n=2 Tax=Actinomyces gaoshouyii TaxID=1960083 RepID=A0A8H9LKW1_9ACTO|nr:1,4-dihydroxy-2-naphthoyl-CoA synthase [Actinomyces gaoshouyii]
MPMTAVSPSPDPSASSAPSASGAPAPVHHTPRRVSEIFDPLRWREVEGFGASELTDVTYHRGCERDADGAWLRDLPVVRVAIDRPEVRNAFRPRTVDELAAALDHARMSGDVGAVILTGNGPSPRDGGWAFSSGGDQRIRGRDGYLYETDDGTAHASGAAAASQGPSPSGAYSHEADVAAARAHADTARAGRLHILEVQRLIRMMPKVVIAAVSGWAAGGGHSLNVVCDLSLASLEHARFKQTDANVGSFDAGYGSALLARQCGDKRAREIFFLARAYDARDAERWGVVNEAVPHAELEERALEYAAIVTSKSPQAIRMLKYAFNMADDGLAGQQVFAGEATRLAYMTDEAVEGRDAFLARREPDWSPFPYYF